MTDARKPLEAFTLDKLIGRFHELEDENERMRPVFDAAMVLGPDDDKWVAYRVHNLKTAIADAKRDGKVPA